ncbi:alpha/beta hydrolase-fold protein [Microbacterium sp. W1N]|uniref:alpha/beta hydrolase n=1 Tax=Microbacterium festucae TaxID=2977531 RepID=UPI0021C20332|nr:alpha/beta hydrolase-fold protein [Microbacterium festucae]MCT9819133.1 alpha/beta hydrolase-fold protein [Microbacterium festucae]
MAGAGAEIPELDADAVVWSHAPGDRAGRPLLVLLHGYGSHEQDLFALVPHLPDGVTIAAVRAPLAPPFPTPGWSWFPIEGLRRHDPVSTTAAAERFLAWLDTLAHDGPVGLLGFSQGGVIALQALRLRPEAFAFVVDLAGYADPAPVAGDERLAALRPPVFWGRGARDEVIPAPLVEHSVAWLPAHVDLSGRVYPGLAHSVSQDELDDVVAFLTKRLGELDAQPAASAPA